MCVCDPALLRVLDQAIAELNCRGGLFSTIPLGDCHSCKRAWPARQAVSPAAAQWLICCGQQGCNHSTVTCWAISNAADSDWIQRINF
jgi:hypothetical protein